jgi:hypothetical protein
MSAFLDDVCGWLDANSTALTKLSGTSGNLVKAVMGDETGFPDTLVVLHENMGQRPVHSFSTATGGSHRDYERLRLQVLTRSTSYATARSLAQVVFGKLDGLGATEMPSSTGTHGHYLDCAASESPYYVGRDANQRYLVSCNFDLRRST